MTSKISRNQTQILNIMCVHRPYSLRIQHICIVINNKKLCFFFLNRNRITETGIVRSWKFTTYFSKNTILLYTFSLFHIILIQMQTIYAGSLIQMSYMIIYLTYRLRAKERERNEIETGSIWIVQNLNFINC